jgi:hypothetical protein
VTFAFEPGDPSPEDSYAELADAWAAAATRYGFAAPGAEPDHLDRVRRRRRVQLLTHSATETVEHVQQYLADPDPEVRDAARNGTRRVMHRCYTGDRSERAWRSDVKPYLADSWIGRALGTPADDGPQPSWTNPQVQRLTRLRLILAACLAAVGAAVLVACHLPLFAVPFLFAAAGFDVADGAYARVVGMRDAELRWLSCVASHLCDLTVLGAVAFAAYEAGSTGLALAVVVAMLVSMVGSFVRVSALQAGYQFWRSRNERVVRYVTLLSYCVLVPVHGEAPADLMIAVVLTAFGVAEVARVLVSVARMPVVRAAGVVFVDRDDELQWWGLADDDTDAERQHGSARRRIGSLLAHR